MAPYNFEEEKKKISEYETRTDPAEYRGPTQKFELPEQEGWAQKVRNYLQQRAIVKCGLLSEQLKRLKSTEISDQQLKWHADNQIEISEPELQVDEEGNDLFMYLPHGMSVPWDEDTGEAIVQNLGSSTDLFIRHCPPNLPKRDRRFKQAFENDKERCQKCGYELGVHHLGLRREKGNFHQIPGMSDETVSGSHNFLAVCDYFKALTPVKQTLGMLYSICFPREFSKAQNIVQYWSDESALKALVHTPREFSTYLALNTNVISEPHIDPTDSGDMWTVMHSWGDFDRETGGHLALPIFNRVYKLYPDSVVFLKASLIQHYVTRWKGMLGQRFSMVHITPKDMADFSAVKLPLTSAEKKAFLAVARADDNVKECPFCHKEMKGTSATNGHLTKIINEGGDKDHPKKDATEWRDKKRAELRSKQKARHAKRKADELEAADEEASDSEEEVQKFKSKKPRVKALKAVPTSEQYERYGNALFLENEKKGSTSSR